MNGPLDPKGVTTQRLGTTTLRTDGNVLELPVLFLFLLHKFYLNFFSCGAGGNEGIRESSQDHSSTEHGRTRQGERVKRGIECPPCAGPQRE